MPTLSCTASEDQDAAQVGGLGLSHPELIVWLVDITIRWSHGVSRPVLVASPRRFCVLALMHPQSLDHPAGKQLVLALRTDQLKTSVLPPSAEGPPVALMRAPR